MSPGAYSYRKKFVTAIVLALAVVVPVPSPEAARAPRYAVAAQYLAPEAGSGGDGPPGEGQPVRSPC